jgi:hypothetical protein
MGAKRQRAAADGAKQGQEAECRCAIAGPDDVDVCVPDARRRGVSRTDHRIIVT